MSLATTTFPTQAWAAPVACECVRALRELAGVNVRGDANTLVPNTTFPDIQPGDVLILRYGKVYHAALAIATQKSLEYIDDESFYNKAVAVTIQEWNYKPCKGTVRQIVASDSHIVGVYRPA